MPNLATEQVFSLFKTTLAFAISYQKPLVPSMPEPATFILRRRLQVRNVTLIHAIVKWKNFARKTTDFLADCSAFTRYIIDIS